MLYDPDNLDDFGMLEDDIGKKYLAEEAERKRKEYVSLYRRLVFIVNP